MPPAAKTNFLALYAAESAVQLPLTDDDISAARDAYGAIYSKGSSKRSKDLRAETLAGLSWLHLNHKAVADALRRIAEPHQLLLATALGLDYESLSAKPPWPAILSHAIASRAIPGDTPTKRKSKQPRASSRAEKPGVHSDAELNDDDIDEVVSPEEDPWPSNPLPSKKKETAKQSQSSASGKRPPSSPSPPPTDPPRSGSSEPDEPSIPQMPDTYDDGADICARADKLCRLPWIQSTLLAN